MVKFLAEFCGRGKTYRKVNLNFCLNTTKNSRKSDLYAIKRQAIYVKHNTEARSVTIVAMDSNKY